MRILRANDIQAALAMPEAITCMREAFAQVADGSAVQPDRVAVRVAAHDGSMLAMPGFLPRGQRLGLKVVSVFPHNAERLLPVVPAVVLLLDATTGLPLALLEATTLTALRTGAASGLAADLLARPDARVVTLFGAGGQAPFQLEAVCRVRGIERAWLVNRTSGHAEGLRVHVMGWPEWRPDVVRVAQNPAEVRQAVEESDIILTATAAAAPLFAGEWVRAGTHISAIGAFTPAMREVDSTLVGRAKVVVDQRAAALAEAGDLLQAIREGAFTPEAIYAELGEIVLGSKPGRASRSEITFFKSVGIAAQDLAVAGATYEVALKVGLGAEVDLYGAG